MPAPEELEDLLDEAEDALDDGDPERALELCGRVLRADARHPGALFVAADAERTLGELERAEQSYRMVTAIEPDHAHAWSGLAWVLFDQLRFPESRVAALRALRASATNAEAVFVRAMLRERRGDLAGSERDYLRASRLDPENYPRPVRLPDAVVTALVEEARKLVHPSVRSYLEQVVFVVEDVPSAELCQEFDPPALPGELLGFFSGNGLADRGVDSGVQVPSRIVLFRKNLERIAQDRDQLIQEIRITVLHEIGHFLGLDEDDLEERGLD